MRVLQTEDTLSRYAVAKERKVLISPLGPPYMPHYEVPATLYKMASQCFIWCPLKPKNRLVGFCLHLVPGRDLVTCT